MKEGIRVWGLVTSKIAALILVILFFLYPIPYTLYPVSAADSTPSADIKAKLEELKKEIASKAAALKQQVDKKLQNKAYVGKLKTKSTTALTIATKNGPKIVNINQDTVFDTQIKSVKGQKTPTLKSLAEEDYLAALGDVDETGVLTAKKVILLPTPDSQQHTTPSGSKTYLWGQIVSVSDQLATLKDKDSKTVAVSLPDSSTVKLNDFVILTGNKAKNDIFKAEFVYVIPQGGILKPKKMATPSAQVATHSATPSAKPKAMTR